MNISNVQTDTAIKYYFVRQNTFYETGSSTYSTHEHGFANDFVYFMHKTNLSLHGEKKRLTRFKKKLTRLKNKTK